MSKAVMLSIRPEWCEKIANGEKTIEVRKTRPKLRTPFKCYIYCTRPKREHEDFIRTDFPKPQFYGGGKVIGEFTCKGFVPFNGGKKWPNLKESRAQAEAATPEVLKKACMTEKELWAYEPKGNPIGWCISDLRIYDTPRELSEFWFPPERYCEKELCGGCPCDQVADVNGEYEFDCEWRRPLSRAPQSWCYVEVMENV